MFLHDFQEFKGLRFRFLAPSKKKEKTRNKFEFNYSQDSCFSGFWNKPFGVTNDDIHACTCTSGFNLVNSKLDRTKKIETKIITIEIFNKS